MSVLNKIEQNDVIKLIKILFPHFSHYDWSKPEAVNLHFGKHSKNKGGTHRGAILVVEFVSPAWHEDNYKITFFEDGMICFKNSMPVEISHQFSAYKFLKKFYKLV